MDSIQVQGGVALRGEVTVQGSKNAVLPILAATLLADEATFLKGCPRITDVYKMTSLLNCLGKQTCWEKDGLRILPGACSIQGLPSEAITQMRSSICLLGSLIGVRGEVTLEYPGGCVIGKRPINLHIDALRRMGVVFEEQDRYLHARAGNLHGADITLPFASVGATENVILTAVQAEGDTTLRGAAAEPEVQALCRYLNACGAQIEGIGSHHLIIRGGRRLGGTDFVVPADRIVAGTYLFCGVATGGEIFLRDAPVKEMDAVLRLAERMGAQCTGAQDGLYVQGPRRCIAPSHIVTGVYPEFPTDLQSVALATLTRGEGTCIVEERIFENRFRIVEPLKKMGADIVCVPEKQIAVVKGVDRLVGTSVEVKELRGGAALLLAALMAEGMTCVSGCTYIYRGYENICRDLRALGARIVSV